MSDTHALQTLLAHIDELGGGLAMPVVPLDAFFAGNAEEASIAPNIEPHPGVEEIWDALQAVQARPDVHGVVMRISEVMDDEEWPYADIAYVITTADAAAIERDVAGLGCEIRALDPDAWQADAHPGAPEVPPGHHVVELWWD